MLGSYEDGSLQMEVTLSLIDIYDKVENASL
jgi:hypothetical protein